jgi:hypothetical protein
LASGVARVLGRIRERDRGGDLLPRLRRSRVRRTQGGSWTRTALSVSLGCAARPPHLKRHAHAAIAWHSRRGWRIDRAGRGAIARHSRRDWRIDRIGNSDHDIDGVIACAWCSTERSTNQSHFVYWAGSESDLLDAALDEVLPNASARLRVPCGQRRIGDLDRHVATTTPIVAPYRIEFRGPHIPSG